MVTVHLHYVWLVYHHHTPNICTQCFGDSHSDFVTAIIQPLEKVAIEGVQSVHYRGGGGGGGGECLHVSKFNKPNFWIKTVETIN